MSDSEKQNARQRHNEYVGYTGEPNKFGRPKGSEYDPTGDELSIQEATDRIQALFRKAQNECYAPEYPDVNQRNAGRVRALGQALKLLERAGVEPIEGEVWLSENEEMCAGSGDNRPTASDNAENRDAGGGT